MFVVKLTFSMGTACGSVMHNAVHVRAMRLIDLTIAEVCCTCGSIQAAVNIALWCH